MADEISRLIRIIKFEHGKEGAARYTITFLKADIVMKNFLRDSISKPLLSVIEKLAEFLLLPFHLHNPPELCLVFEKCRSLHLGICVVKELGRILRVNPPSDPETLPEFWFDGKAKSAIRLNLAFSNTYKFDRSPTALLVWYLREVLATGRVYMNELTLSGYSRYDLETGLGEKILDHLQSLVKFDEEQQLAEAGKTLLDKRPLKLLDISGHQLKDEGRKLARLIMNLKPSPFYGVQILNIGGNCLTLNSLKLLSASLCSEKASVKDLRIARMKEWGYGHAVEIATMLVNNLKLMSLDISGIRGWWPEGLLTILFSLQLNQGLSRLTMNEYTVTDPMLMGIIEALQPSCSHLEWVSMIEQEGKCKGVLDQFTRMKDRYVGQEPRITGSLVQEVPESYIAGGRDVSFVFEKGASPFVCKI